VNDTVFENDAFVIVVDSETVITQTVFWAVTLNLR
jgi:hypothetical protein